MGTGQTLQAADVEAGGTTAASQGWLLSSDSHIVEPPDLWTARMPYDDRLPRVVREDDGDWWYIDGRKTMSFLGIQPGMRFDKRPEHTAHVGDLRRGGQRGLRPARLRRRPTRPTACGARVIYPSEGLVLFGVPNTDVVTEAMRVYNDWIAEFCAHDPSASRASPW